MESLPITYIAVFEIEKRAKTETGSGIALTVFRKVKQKENLQKHYFVFQFILLSFMRTHVENTPVYIRHSADTDVPFSSGKCICFSMANRRSNRLHR